MKLEQDGSAYWPTLYKKTSTGKIQYWTISTIPDPDHSVGFQIWTNYGQVGGKEQETVDSIYEGKNVGKKNETSPHQQALAEAQAKWEKQKKKGYVETIDDASNDKVDDLIEGGVLPMLAAKFHEQAHKIEYPAAIQPKLDGIRCIAIVKDGECTLWSRTRKPITSVPHIIQEIEAIFGNTDIILDGELYNHEYKKDFEKIVSLVRKEEPAEDCQIVQYHVYDQISSLPFEQRYAMVAEIIQLNDPVSIKLVPTQSVFDEDDVARLFESAVELGFEGAMVRNANSPYVGKRSFDLQKVKEFEDAEFKIVGIEEGRGKLAGHAIFVCVDQKGDEFKAKMKGDTSKLKRYFDDHSLWQGKQLTVRYFGLTGKKKVPRFPVAIIIRDYE